ncbi:Sulfate/thiosulfate import ATP-binding protein CysA [Leminorella richardii]|uniref:Sulfate/thiosulfate import ATP-binding protein CysA n=1 Tax=Leminorella richardii TaxID=158841 RepID=A0A2X4UCS0_9GAMM|nr:ATP-binding cassette domain-containing protein [Leminorella richardii]SQI36661.1 Sulfate/thiosulfate import ATP-binding protein CysA [Leminorella richardii]
MLSVNDLSCGVLDSVSFTAVRGECTAICGPSGSGKTTLLNAIAGHVDYRGSILIGDVNVNSIPAWRRPCRHLNQRLYLFPFLTIENNLKMAQYAAGQPRLKEKRKEVLEWMEIGQLGGRYPSQLSGGEQQRAALARALVTEPGLLLLDEPFSSLDWSLRTRLWACLQDVQRRLSTTILLVSHEPREVDALASRRFSLQEGRLKE